jgi:hypothetical protein
VKIVSTIFKIGVPVLAIAALLWLGSEFGILQFRPVEVAADGRLNKRAVDAFEDQQVNVDATSNFDEAARLNKEAKEELARKRALISSTPPPPPQQSAQMPVVATPPPPSPTEKGVRLPTPLPSVKLLGDNKWEVVLPADLEYHTGIRPSDTQKAVFSGWVGEVKLDPQETFVNRSGGSFATNRAGLVFSEPFVSFQAWVGALLARQANQDTYTDVGGRENNSLLAVGDSEIVLSINCLAGERHNASGGYRGIIEVQ